MPYYIAKYANDENLDGEHPAPSNLRSRMASRVIMSQNLIFVHHTKHHRIDIKKLSIFIY
jgi:hypothetical protein